MRIGEARDLRMVRHVEDLIRLRELLQLPADGFADAPAPRDHARRRARISLPLWCVRRAAAALDSHTHAAPRRERRATRTLARRRARLDRAALRNVKDVQAHSQSCRRTCASSATTRP